jgi:Amt family ammonium transporter
MNAAAAVLNTNLATAVALLTWLFLDMSAGPHRKPTFLGAVNGMITGLVAITPAAGFANGWGALLIGLVASIVVWLSWNKSSGLLGTPRRRENGGRVARRRRSALGCCSP